MGIAGWQGDDRATAEAGVTELYQAHALGLIRLAQDRASARGPQNAGAAHPIRFGVVAGSRFIPLPGEPPPPRPGTSWPVW